MNATPLLLMECPLAGFQHHAGEAHWSRIKPRDHVTLRREPGNRHDPRAIAVEWQGVILGYVPREANFALAQMIDRGERVEARIARLQPGGDPWSRVALELFAAPAHSERGAPVTSIVRNEVRAPRPPAQGEARIEVRSIAAPILAAQPPRPQRLTTEVTVTRDHLRLLEAACGELTRRLALPAVVTHERGRRTVKLWEAIEVSVSDAGRDMQARYLETASIAPPVAASLATPIGRFSWTTAFVPALVGICNELGLPRSLLKEASGKWLHSALRLTFRRHLDYHLLRRSVLEALKPDPLIRSLANRIFGVRTSVAQFNWVTEHLEALSLAAIEHPRLMPFIRYVERDAGARASADPLRALRSLLADLGVTPAVSACLERWGDTPFWEYSGGTDYFDSLAAVADYATLLHHVEAGDVVPAHFGMLAAQVALFGTSDPCSPAFIAYPAWFMRALLREAEAIDDDLLPGLSEELGAALQWLEGTRPSPDANQRKAGWSWIAAQALDYVAKRDAKRWSVPCEPLEVGGYRVVPVCSGAELREEAQEMRNCLENFRGDCESGRLLVFSLREVESGRRVACFSASLAADEARRPGWQLREIAGKMNQPVPAPVRAVAIVALSRIRWGSDP